MACRLSVQRQESLLDLVIATPTSAVEHADAHCQKRHIGEVIAYAAQRLTQLFTGHHIILE
ncbi:hypothetical protein [Actimicrobium antarcticum]